MITKKLFPTVLIVWLVSCQPSGKDSTTEARHSDVKIAGAMKNVMWKGELAGVINLDTIENTTGLYGLGPLSFLSGEILINDGKSYVSRVVSDSEMSVEKTFQASAPFFVYANVDEWAETDLPEHIITLKELEAFVDEKTKDHPRPFAFKMKGTVSNASIHIQNLPPGTKVSSPQEAHQGQTNYKLENEPVEIVGFFSTDHKGVFTHHDSFLHLHLITADESKMGHLDEAQFGKMTLFLPKK
ncbi:MAG: acetolactate decarboxylase [Bacteroidia bacterium]